jgi:hypothetical protein
MACSIYVPCLEALLIVFVQGKFYYTMTADCLSYNVGCMKHTLILVQCLHDNRLLNESHLINQLQLHRQDLTKTLSVNWR